VFGDNGLGPGRKVRGGSCGWNGSPGVIGVGRRGSTGLGLPRDVRSRNEGFPFCHFSPSLCRQFDVDDSTDSPGAVHRGNGFEPGTVFGGNGFGPGRKVRGGNGLAPGFMAGSSGAGFPNSGSPLCHLCTTFGRQLSPGSVPHRDGRGLGFGSR
jgi:hypothetical protein